MPASHLAYLPSFQSMRSGGLLDATDLNKFFNMVLGAQGGIVAHAGGGIPLATQVTYGFNSVDTVATAADSVMLPPAIINGWVWVFNGGAASMNVYNTQVNPQNGGLTDVIVPHGVAAPNAGNVAIALAVGHCALFVCVALGRWKQVADFA
jgi:hypothetical protein